MDNTKTTNKTDKKKVVFKVENLTMDFNVSGKGVFSKSKQLRALNDVSFDLHQGEALAVVGESGCGKSTICRIAMRFHKPSNGKMYFEEDNIHGLKGEKLKNYRQKAQMIFQDPFSALNPLHSIYYHLERPIKLYHRSNAKSEKYMMDSALELVGLVPAEEQGKKYPHQLSGGQKQRAYIARVLAAGAEVIFADEPTSMLDVSIRLGVLNLMNKLKIEHGKSFIYITHDIATARYFADRIIVLYAGHIVEHGDVNKVIINPQHPYTQLLVAAAPDPERTEDVVLPVKSSEESEISMWTPDSTGCPFKNRCLYAKDICHKEMPGETMVEDGQYTRCHKFSEDF